MYTQQIIRAWRDADYRDQMSDMERAALPAHPAGLIQLDDTDLSGVQRNLSIATELGPISPSYPICTGNPCQTF